MSLKSNIAIIGQGICCGAGNNLDQVWNNLIHGNCEPAAGDNDFFYPHPSSPLFTVKENNILSFCPKNYLDDFSSFSLQNINRTIELSLTAICEALKSAGISPAELKEKRVGIAMGTTVGCTFHNEDYYINWKRGKSQDQVPVHTYLSSNLAERLQSILQINGPRAVITNACSSGTDAIGLGKTWLEQELCDLVIAGGADEISRVACHGFSSLMLFSQKTCIPFDVNRDGLNLGEGAGVLVLEREERSQEKNQPALGVLKGYGAACDAYHPTAPHPDGIGLQKAIEMACSQSKVDPQQIAFINAHGTGTIVNDQAELTALHEFGYTKENCPPIVSTKGATGHTLGAAGGIEAVLTLTSLLEGKTAGSTGCITEDPQFSLPVIQDSLTTEIKGNIGMSQSLAFGGSNSVLLIEACPA